MLLRPLLRPLWRLLRFVLALLLLLLALGALVGKVWLEASGPFVEALPAYPFCQEAALALEEDRVADALELAEVGDCATEEAQARARWESLAATLDRCWEGVWTGRGEDAAGVGCAVASDLVVFGDVRDLSRQALAWGQGEATDPVLIGLSTAGLVLTFAPQVGAGNALLKVARRAGALSAGLGRSVSTLVRQRAWRPLADLFSDAGRISTKLGPARATRALAYADSPAEMASLARFVESASHPLVGLRLGGKRVAGIADDGLYRVGLARGPAGLQLAAERGSAALLSRKPLLVWAAKSVYRHPDAVASALLVLATWLLRWATWPLVLVVAGVASLAGLALWPRGRRLKGSRPAPTRTGASRAPRDQQGGRHDRHSSLRTDRTPEHPRDLRGGGAERRDAGRGGPDLGDGSGVRRQPHRHRRLVR